MAITELRVSGYRSIRQISLSLGRINVLTGPNGSGKTGLYTVMRLLADAIGGGLARGIAREGGMASVLWAGAPKRFGKRPEQRRIKLAIRTDDFGYDLEFGPREQAATGSSQFRCDPQIERETVWLPSTRGGRVVSLDRQGPLVSLRDAEGKVSSRPVGPDLSVSALAENSEPHRYPELFAVRTQVAGWRFYDRFLTDADSPARQPRAGALTPVLDRDGSDLAAALQTVIEIGDADALRGSVEQAFPGARLELRSEESLFRVVMQMLGMQRPLEATELSSGTLRYLCLLAALLSPRPPELLGLNEPEAGLHPDLIAPLAQLITNASKRSQLWIRTQSPLLAEKVQEISGEQPVELRMVDGETKTG